MLDKSTQRISGLPDKEDVKIEETSKIAAHAADLARGNKGAYHRDYLLSRQDRI